jgi:curved DNA-binding protein CbpA
VSSVPAEIAGLGSSAMKLRVSPGFDPLKAQVGPDEYFVLSRIDGTLTVRDVLLATGLPIERGIAIITKLRSIGALLLPGESSAPMPAAAPARPTQRAGSTTPASPYTPPHGVAAMRGTQPVPPVGRTTTPSTPMAGSKLPARAPLPPLDLEAPTEPRTQIGVHPAAGMRPPLPEGLDAPTVRGAPMSDLDLVLPKASATEKAALVEDVELETDERVRILAMMRLMEGRDPWALLGVPSGAEAKVLKRAYFKLSKEIHPDRYYGKKLGSYAERLTTVFEAVSRAYAKLTSPEKDRRSGVYQAVSTEQPQTPAEYAGELFERACGLEVSGDALGAMKLFAAAVRIDPQTRYLRRAATCALAAGQPKTALEYAKKAQAQAPNDPSSARLLAGAFRAIGKLADAEEVLVMAMALKSENDVLTAELRNDLAEVRRLLSAPSG